MADTHTDQHTDESEPETVLEFGGLRFGVSFREAGATLRVSGRPDNEWVEMLRFDDFFDQPHYHAPSSGPGIMFDRSLGEPLAWYVTQIRDHLAEWLARADFATVLPTVDLAAVTDHADEITRAMEECVPEGFARVPGIGLQRIEVTA